jgi:signal transduction histidine kinase/ActR/RegA family two-component response regulator
VGSMRFVAVRSMVDQRPKDGSSLLGTALAAVVLPAAGGAYLLFAPDVHDAVVAGVLFASALASGTIAFVLARANRGARELADRRLGEAQRLEAAARASDARVKQLIDRAPMGVALSDHEGKVIEANDLFLGIIGGTREELERRELSWSEPPGEQEYVRRDDSRVPIWVASEILDAAKPRRLSFVVDLHEMIRVDRERVLELEREAFANDLVRRTGLALTASTELEQVLPALTRAAIELTGARDGSFRSDFVKKEIVREDDVLDRPHLRGKSLEALGLPADKMQTLRSYLVVPVVAGTGECFGSMILGHPEPNRFTPVHLRVLSALAEHAVVAIENAKLSGAKVEAIREAESASRVKDAFLAIASHELRTPLNAILGWSQVLRTSTFAEERVAEGLATIERNAKIQAQVLNDLLDISRITTGKTHLEVERVDPSLAIEGAIEGVRLAAAAKEITISTALDNDAGTIIADPRRLQQIVWNLLSNAVKFTPRGGQAEISMRRHGSHLEISVRDTGIGIHSEFLPQLFAGFRQVDMSTTRRFGGLGLGLMIVRHLVELHGGVVRAESNGEGKGSTFIVFLPISTTAAPLSRGNGIGEHPVRHPSRISPGLRVLIVDDERDARELLRIMLEEARAEVETADSVSSAMRAIPRFRPNVLVSDIGMPDEDGYTLIRRVRGLAPEEGGNTPAVALTAFVRTEDRLRALQEGFQVHISKPVDANELRRAVAKLGRADGRQDPL